MVEARLTLELEVKAILDCVDNGSNFLLSGGAGSGKTFSLVQVIRQVIIENPTSKVACMTYTNSAVKEIEDRVNHRNLNVTTIHDFLWDNIKHFQKELKNCLVELINNIDETRIKITGEDQIQNSYFDNLENGIQYKEYLKLKEGIISHEELLIIANCLFEKYQKICSIVKDKYKFIFIDEYQDTSPLVISIFLNHLKSSNKANIIGFFGDSMQAIYDGTIGNLQNYIDTGEIVEIQKNQNRRNPSRVIELANKLRTDGLVQTCSNDSNAPNMLDGNLKEGNILFLYSSDNNIDKAKHHLVEDLKWNIDNVGEYKELNLTHNLISFKAGFKNLMDLYNGDKILEYRNRIKNFIKDNNILENFNNNTFGEVIEYLLTNFNSARETRAIKPTPAMQAFIEDNEDLYNIALEQNYLTFSKMYIDKDQLIDDKKQDEITENKKGSKRDSLIKHLYKIQKCIYLYNNGIFNEFIKITDYKNKLNSIESKRILKENIELLTIVQDKNIEEIIELAHETGVCFKDDKLEKFINEKSYIYNQVKEIQFTEIQNLFNYLEGKTPFSTKHKTKGSEYNNVFVILDNGNWRNYDFSNLFLKDGNASVLERTGKIFYVCCTRAKENLAIYFNSPSESVLDVAKDWFGEENVLNLDSL
jgi:DNA helicase-2/ATP-dependent DNA helicase PcrA